jgi:hypothetical protein
VWRCFYGKGGRVRVWERKRVDWGVMVLVLERSSIRLGCIAERVLRFFFSFS